MAGRLDLPFGRPAHEPGYGFSRKKTRQAKWAQLICCKIVDMELVNSFRGGLE